MRAMASESESTTSSTCVGAADPAKAAGPAPGGSSAMYPRKATSLHRARACTAAVHPSVIFGWCAGSGVGACRGT
jgi:hypothetical protein